MTLQRLSNDQLAAERAHHVDLLALIGADTPLKRVAATNGGEWAGPCPWCGGVDRFRVWPNSKRPGWWCRGCDRKGDAAGYLMQRRGISYPEALRQLGIEPERSGHGGVSQSVGSPVKPVKRRETGVKAVKADVKPVKAGLSVAELAAAKRLPEAFLRSLGLRDVRLRSGPAVAIPYLDSEGSEVALRYRLALEGDSRFRWRKGASVLPYGLQRLADARKAGWLLIVEGESDCWTAWHHGIPALGLPGKTMWRPNWAAYLSGLGVYVWQEPDAADFSLRLGKDLPNARVIVAPDGIKDISEAHCAGLDVGTLLGELKPTARPVAEIVREQASAEIAALAEKACSVLDAHDPLELVESAIRDLGYGGDITPAAITYLCLTTRLLTMRPGAMPAHLLLVGPPSAGKSYTLQLVLRLLPEEAYHTIDAGSPRVLIYDDADLRHRTVVFSEADSLPAGEDNPAASAIRNLLQDHELSYDVVERDPETDAFTVRKVRRPGPTMLVTTAVRELGGQLGTRVFTLPVPEDVKRIQDALAAQAGLEIDGAAEVDSALIDFQAYLQRLAPWEVVVPFARELASAIGRSANAIRILRDYQRLLSLVKAVAILQHRRRTRQPDGRLAAEIEDYATVYRLVGQMYEASLTGATEGVRAVVGAVAELRTSDVARVTYSAVAAKVGLHPEQVRRLAKLAIKHGWLTNEETRKNQPADLNIGEPLPERTGLPTPEELAAAFTAFHAISQRFTVSQPDQRIYEQHAAVKPEVGEWTL